MIRLRGADHTDDTARDTSDELSSAIARLRAWMRSNPADQTPARTTVQTAAGVLGIESLRQHVGARQAGEDLDILLNAFTARLTSVTLPGQDWPTSLTAFEASEAVSLLTVHRSKGLEYHTVFFLDIDDNQWWSHDKDGKESLSTFFVGLSRAAQRIIFTNSTPGVRNGTVADLYAMLDAAGVPEHPQGSRE